MKINKRIVDILNNNFLSTNGNVKLEVVFLVKMPKDMR